MRTEIVEDVQHLHALCKARRLTVRFLGKLGGYEVATTSEEIVKLYGVARARGHYLIARSESDTVAVSIGAPMTRETLEAFGLGGARGAAH